MDINIHNEVGICNLFTDKDGNKSEVSIVISPLKVRINENGDKVQIVTGCNLWMACHNPACYYSNASRQNKRVPAEKKKA